MGYCKLCDLDDFSRPELAGYLREIYPVETRSQGANPLAGREDRKSWEVSMAARTLTDFGATDESAEVLGVGAGVERTIFWLTQKVRRVFATDLYLEPGDWERTAKGSMLVSPGEHTTLPWNPRRLVVQHMNALEALGPVLQRCGGGRCRRPDRLVELPARCALRRRVRLDEHPPRDSQT